MFTLPRFLSSRAVTPWLLLAQSLCFLGLFTDRREMGALHGSLALQSVGGWRIRARNNGPECCGLDADEMVNPEIAGRWSRFNGNFSPASPSMIRRK